MASSLIKHKRITTTLAKAKALRQYVEPLITKSKSDTTHSRRTVFSYLQDKDAVTILFREISEKVATRPGGYTRIIKLENRMGDNAEMAFIELVDYNEIYKKETDTTERKSTRRRGGKKKSGAEAAAVVTAEAVESAEAVEEATETVEETVAVETEAAATPEEPEAPVAEEENKQEETTETEEAPKEDKKED